MRLTQTGDGQGNLTERASKLNLEEGSVALERNLYVLRIMGVVRSWRVSATVAVNAIARCRVRSRRRTTCEDPKPPQPSFPKISAVAFAGPFALPGAKAARGIADSHSHPLTQAQPSCSQPCQTRTGGARLSWSTTLAARRLRGTCPPCGMTSARLCAPGEEWELRAGRRRAPVSRAGRGRGRGGAGSPHRVRGRSPDLEPEPQRCSASLFLPAGPARRWSFRTSGLTVPSQAVSAWVRGGAPGGGAGWRGSWSCGYREGWAPETGNAG